MWIGVTLTGEPSSSRKRKAAGDDAAEQLGEEDAEPGLARAGGEDNSDDDEGDMPGTGKRKAAKMPKLPKSKKPQSADARSRRMAARQPELSGQEYEGRLEAVSALQASSGTSCRMHSVMASFIRYIDLWGAETLAPVLSW